MGASAPSDTQQGVCSTWLRASGSEVHAGLISPQPLKTIEVLGTGDQLEMGEHMKDGGWNGGLPESRILIPRTCEHGLYLEKGSQNSF